MLADMALGIAQTLLAQQNKRSAELPIVDIPGQVALPSDFYTLTSREGVRLSTSVEHTFLLSIYSAAVAVPKPLHMVSRQWQDQAE